MFTETYFIACLEVVQNMITVLSEEALHLGKEFPTL